MVLSNKIGEATGMLVGVRTFPDGSLEAQFQGSGTFLGHPIRDTGTILFQTQETGGYRFEGNIVLVAKDNGAMCAWRGFGISKKEDRPMPAGNYAAAGEFPKATHQFGTLRDVCCVVDYKVNENERYTWEAYEWKGAY